MGYVFAGMGLLAIVAIVAVARRNRQMRDEMTFHEDEEGVVADLERGDAAYDSEAWRGDQHWPDEEDERGY